MDLGSELKGKLYATTIEKGDVYLSEFEGIDHEKFFIVAGLSKDKVFACSVFINSNIHPFIRNRQHLLDLQVYIKKSNYKFLHHDSYVDCSSPKPFDIERFKSMVQNQKCRHKGKVNTTDLQEITDTLINSDLLSEEDIELYF